MNGGTRSRWPYLVAAIAMAVLAGTLALSALNGTFGDDLFFNVLAVALVLGYSTVGALLASRNPRNPLGWLMMTVAICFIVSGFAAEYTGYAYETDPGSLPLPTVAASLTNYFWLPIFAAIELLVLLFPTGRVPGPRWRYLPRVIVGLVALYLVGAALLPGPLDELPVDVRIENAFGVEALEPVADIAAGIGAIGVLLAILPAIVAVVLRYRRSHDEERQQIRWLAYVAGTTATVIVVGMATALILGEAFGSSFLSSIFALTGFALVGVGIPLAMGVAVLKYRLYDLDVVVKKTVLYATVAVLLTAIFLVVAVVIGGIAGKSDAGAVVAAAIIGVSFWPALRLARRISDRIVYGGRATPYEVLADFSTRVGGSYGAEDVLPRMARVLAGAVGASRAIVWLRVGGEIQAAGVSPAGDVPDPIPVSGEDLPPIPADSAVEVRERDELLGALAVSMPANDPIDPSRERLVRDLATQAGLVLRNVRLIEELRASRRRIVEAQDERAKALERNIHDGAQQQLVALSVKQRLAEALVDRDPERSRGLMAELQADTVEALETLRDLARGIYPPLLADKGLAIALEAQVRKAPIDVELRAEPAGRYPEEIEAAVYFCCLEALQNVSKYANASKAGVRLLDDDGRLTFIVEDDGAGFDPITTARGTGLQGMADRLEALGGDLEIRSRPGRGTTLRGWIPTRTSVAAASAD